MAYSTAPGPGASTPAGAGALSEDTTDAMARTWMGRTSSQTMDPDEALVGTAVGTFQIVRKLAQGGMGSVFLARNEAIGSQVAVKFLHPHLAADPRLVARFYAEARAVNLIGHPNIVTIFDMGVLPPARHYLVMEYLDGLSLSELHGPVPPGTLVPILTQVCDALAAAHRHDIVHRDLKPENIQLVQRGDCERFVKLLDFGVAKMNAGPSSAASSVTSSVGLILGTPEYMAPEQGLSMRVDGRSDLYSLGVIAFRMATGQLPFTGGLMELLRAHQEQPPPCPRSIQPELPQALANVILRALAKRPEDRFQTAEAFKAALLEAVADKRPTPPPRPAREPELEAVFTDASGRELGQLRCIQLSRGGMFACTDGVPPPLFSRLNATLRLAGADHGCGVEVVRHSRREEAAQWGMPAGFAVQFVDPSPALKEAISRLGQGAAPSAPVQPAPVPRLKDDGVAARVLGEVLAREALNPYAVLDVAPDCTLDELRVRARTERRRLEELKERPLSDAQKQKLARCLEQVDWAAALLGHPARRARHDASIGNYRGVSRCILAGLSLVELESLRVRFLAERRGADSKATVLTLTGASFEAQGEYAKSQEQYERALTLDPLRLDLHQRYSKLLRQEDARKRREAKESPAAHRPAAVPPGARG